MTEADYTPIPMPTYDDLVDGGFRNAEMIDRLQRKIERLSGCLLAIHRANHASASALRSVAYDAALNCITPDVAEFQCGARTIEQTGD